MLQPLILQADQNPLVVMADLRICPRPSFLPVTGGNFRRPGRGHAFLGSRQFPRHLIVPHGLPDSALGHDTSSMTHAGYRGGKLWSACDPCPYGQDRASRPPPLQHRVPIRAASNSISRDLRQASALSGSLRGFFSHRSSGSWEQARAPGLATAPFQPHGILDVSYEPLYVTLSRRSAAGESLVCSHTTTMSRRQLPEVGPQGSNPKISPE